MSSDRLEKLSVAVDGGWKNPVSKRSERLFCSRETAYWSDWISWASVNAEVIVDCDKEEIGSSSIADRGWVAGWGWTGGGRRRCTIISKAWLNHCA